MPDFSGRNEVIVYINIIYIFLYKKLIHTEYAENKPISYFIPGIKPSKSEYNF